MLIALSFVIIQIFPHLCKDENYPSKLIEKNEESTYIGRRNLLGR